MGPIDWFSRTAPPSTATELGGHRGEELVAGELVVDQDRAKGPAGVDTSRRSRSAKTQLRLVDRAQSRW